MRPYLLHDAFTSLLLLVLCPQAVISNDDESADVVEYNGIGECSIYFAPSTIPGAGYGLFAGKDYRRKEFVTPGDLIVPGVEMEWHNGHEEFVFLWDDYQWSAGTFPGMESEGERNAVAGYSFGIGALANSFHPLINLEIVSSRMDSAGLHRSRDPGAGAFTPYHNRRSYAYKNIPAGMELFIDYGSDYFPSREKEYGPIPLDENYEEGNQLMSKFVGLQHVCINSSSNEEEETCAANEEEKTCAANPLLSINIQSSLLSLIQSWADIWQSRTLKTLPLDPQHVDYVLEHGTESLYLNRSIQSLEWLQENGICIDTIQAERSTIKQAGRGGFATKFIPQGHVVTAVPLIHIPNRSIFTMYGSMPGIKDSDAQLIRNVSQPIHYQLMLNYCFGHRHSSLLLSPYGILNTVINHSKTRANIKIIWSKRGTRHPEWLNQPVKEWGATLHAGLAFEFVATRDIREGDEILLDYGDEWEAAWQKHVAEWVPLPNSESYATSYELNRRLDEAILTVDEGFYGTDKLFYCRESYRRMRGLEPREGSNLKDTSHPCKVVFRSADRNRFGEYRYIAHIEFEIFDDHDASKVIDTKHEYLFDLPRDAFFFQDVECTRDHALENSFRHDIRIPDDIMPKAWLDLLQEDEA